MSALTAAYRTFAEEVGRLRFDPPVAYTYNPLVYARAPHEAYLERYGKDRKKVFFLGMNPGPWGMAQTGVPFGEVAFVRDWMGISEAVDQPDRLFPGRPVQGFACRRSEVSGRRLWGLMQERFGSPVAFFKNHFVGNYCPLLFLDAAGRNITPDKIRTEQRQPLLKLCDRYLLRVIELLKPEWVIGVGGFTAQRIAGLNRVVSSAQGSSPGSGPSGGLSGDLGNGQDSSQGAGHPFLAGRILHPSPASPQANRGWAEQAVRQLQELGVWD